MDPERISDVGDVGINGWPLGLPPVTARLSVASTSNLIMSSSCSPSSSSTSSSSSAFDSESTASFFPEQSTTLGSLIGVQSSSQMTIVQNESRQYTGIRGAAGRNRAMLRSFLSCGRGLHAEEDYLEVSPSPSSSSSQLSQFLEMEGRGSSQTYRSMRLQYLEERQGIRDMRLQGDDGLAVVHSNEHSCGHSLERMLQQRSPLSPAWNAFNALSHQDAIRNATGSRRHNFWHGFCGKRLATC